VTVQASAPYREVGMPVHSFSRCRGVAAAVFVLAVVTGVLAATASAATTPSKAARAVLRDYVDNNRMDVPHPCGAVQEALRYLTGSTDAPRPGAVNALRTYARTVCPIGSFLAIRGGSRAERRLARIVALRVGGVTLNAVRFREPERALRNEGVRAPELVVTSFEPQTVRGTWESALYAGAYVALAARYRVAIGGIRAGGEIAPVKRFPGFDLYSRKAKSIQVALLRQRLIQMASRVGAHTDELRTDSTPARAIVITLRVSDPAAFLKHRAKFVLNILDRTQVPLLGFYVGVKDARGNLVWATSRLPNQGAVFAIPRLDACSPVSHSEAVGATRLPCPAK
jgi:hypothetical protein